jgi:hypothetical protein
MRPRNPSQALNIEVPCLSMNQYDGLKLETYPDRQNWGPRPLQEWESLLRKPTQEFSAFLQTWLFFGPIQRFFGEPINPADFVHGTGAPGNRVITTAPLLPLLERWTLSMSTGGITPRLWQIMTDLTFLSKINQFWKFGAKSRGKLGRSSKLRCSLTDYIFSGQAPDCRDRRVALSMTVLAETLQEITYLYGRSGKRFVNTIASNTAPQPWGSAIFREMRRLGWCPADLAMMYRRLSAAALYYMSHIERPRKDKTHPMIRIRPAVSSPLDGHNVVDNANELCSSFSCSSQVLIEEQYVTRHVEGCCGCYNMIADYDRILIILKNGNIPLILSIGPEDDSMAITLVESEPSISYVAISHVWSDGLGNPQESALPHCQMLRLSNLIRNLPGRGTDILLFWMDTICCPPDSADRGEAQDLAIRMMRKTYEEATVVLVLDSWLLGLKIEQMPDEEVLMRIICSGWNSRLWTLQEGALADALYFQFSDAAYDVDKGVERLNTNKSLSLELSLKPTIIRRIYEFRGFRQMEKDIYVRLLAVANALKFRSTSVATDEPLCLSALLGFDTTIFVNVPPEDRMRIFWRQFEWIPSLIVFCPFPRLTARGYGWAPQSFLSTKRALIWHGASPMMMNPLFEMMKAEIQNNGVLIKGAGIAFSTERCFLGPTLYLLVGETCRSIFLNLQEADGASPDVYSEDYDNENPEYILNLWDQYGTAEAAFILMPFPNDIANAMGKTGLTIIQGIGIFVSIEREVDDTIYARRICFGHVRGEGPSYSIMEGISTRPGFLPVYGTYDAQASVTSGKLRSGEQNWCIQ